MSGQGTGIALPRDCHRRLRGMDSLVCCEVADWLEQVGRTLRHFETEANAADELSGQHPAGSEQSVRYKTERDTYRYVLKQLLTPALADPGYTSPNEEALGRR